MAVHTNNNTTYYINPAYLTFVENSGYGANLIQVSASSSCYIRVFIRGTIGYDADGNYRRWKVTAYNNKFPDNDAYYIYVRLEKEGASALIVYSKTLYEIDGSGEGVEASDTYYYIKIGEVTATDGNSIREISYDTGRLESNQVQNEGTDLNEMWELDKYSTPWLIKAKQWLSSFTVKGLVTLIGGLVFKKGETEKAITDIKRSIDSDEDVPVSDDNIPTTQYTHDYVESELEKLDDRFLSKIKDDYTPFSLGVGGNLDVGGNASVAGGLGVDRNVSVGGDVKSKDFTEDVTGAGYAMFKNGEGHYRAEADIITARILAGVYDLLVKNNAVFRGNLSSEEFISGFVGGKGWAIRMKEWLNAAGVTETKSVAEFDDLIVRGSMRIYEFIVSQMLGENDNRIFTGMMEVDHYDASDGRVYLKTDGGKLYNPFRADDVIIVQQYGGVPTEDNGYYVTKQYEFIVTEAGIGDTADGENRLDWVMFRDFTTTMEGGDLTLIAERDTLVRLDNISDAARKGIVQIMSVGEDTPYMDFVYGAKTDPDNSLKGRLGNIGGVYNPLFGWLKEFGAYLTNLYAVGEFRIAHTGEDVADAIEIAKGSFRTNYRQTTYDMTEEDNFLTNASFTDDCEGWILGEDSVEYFLVDDLPQYFNYELYASEKTAAVLASYNDRDMLRLFSSSARQSNDLIRKPGTHKEYSGEDEVVEVVDKLYLNVRFYCHADGDFSVGFANSDGTFYENAFYSTGTYEAGVDAYTISLSGTWNSVGDFYMKSTGDIYVDSVSLTDKPLENYKIETSTRIEQDATKISLLAQRISGAESSITNLGIELDATEERITAYVDKEIDGVEASVSQLQIDVNGISTRVATAQTSADNAKKAADAAQKAADDAAADALAAQNTANSANSKAAANATAISQNSQSISAIAAAFQKDASGNLVLTSAAGAVITSEVASLYATKSSVDALGNRVSTAESSITTMSNQIALKASQSSVDALSGRVTTAEGNITTMAGQISLKASQSSVDALGTRVTNAVSSIQVNASNISSKVSKDGIISAINQSAESVTINANRINLNGAITANETFKIDTDGYMTCIGGSIAGFTIEETMLTVEGTLTSANLLGTNDYVTNLQPDGLKVSINGGEKVMTTGLSPCVAMDLPFVAGMHIESSATGSRRSDNLCCIYANITDSDYGVYINGGSTHILSSVVTQIYGLALNTTVASGTLAVNNDFVRMTGNLTLPQPYDAPGKFYFIKGHSSYTLTAPKCVDTNNAYSSNPSDLKWTDSRTRMFVSDGNVWYEFYTTKS